MNVAFADAFYFFAILNSCDPAHEKVVAYSDEHAGILVTTTWILTEVADGLARVENRQSFLQLLEELAADPSSKIIPATQELFERGVSLYSTRRDKPWSLTDCISFVVMRDEGIMMALTGDRHFEQAGFTACLK